MFDPTAWRAGVLHEDPLTRRLAVVLGGRDGEGTAFVVEIGPAGIGYERVHDGEQPRALRIPTDAARALYDALAQHFGGTSNSKQLRADYDAERVRVDKLMTAMTTIATREP